MESDAISLATWNIHEARDLKGKAFDPWAEIKDYDKDVLCLQEFPIQGELGVKIVCRQIRRSSGYPFVAILPLSKAEYYSADPSYRSHRSRQAVAILSRFPMSDIRYCLLPGFEYLPDHAELEPHDKGAVSASIRTRVGMLRIVSLHAFPFHRFGIDSRDMLARANKAFHAIDQFIADEADLLEVDQKLIVAGDFNAEQRWKLLKQPRRLMLRSGFDSDRPTRYDGRNHDDIIADQRLTICQQTILHTKSDHHLLAVNIPHK